MGDTRNTGLLQLFFLSQLRQFLFIFPPIPITPFPLPPLHQPCLQAFSVSFVDGIHPRRFPAQLPKDPLTRQRDDAALGLHHPVQPHPRGWKWKRERQWGEWRQWKSFVSTSKSMRYARPLRRTHLNGYVDHRTLSLTHRLLPIVTFPTIRILMT